MAFCAFDVNTMILEGHDLSYTKVHPGTGHKGPEVE